MFYNVLSIYSNLLEYYISQHSIKNALKILDVITYNKFFIISLSSLY